VTKGDVTISGVEHHVLVEGGTAQFMSAIVLSKLDLRGGKARGVVHVGERTAVDVGQCDTTGLTILRKPNDVLAQVAALTQMH